MHELCDEYLKCNEITETELPAAEKHCKTHNNKKNKIKKNCKTRNSKVTLTLIHNAKLIHT